MESLTSRQIGGWPSIMITIQTFQLVHFLSETNNNRAGTTTISVAYSPNVTVQGECSRDVRPNTKRFKITIN
jgi:hypothetical protein